MKKKNVREFLKKIHDFLDHHKDVCWQLAKESIEFFYKDTHKSSDTVLLQSTSSFFIRSIIFDLSFSFKIWT